MTSGGALLLSSLLLASLLLPLVRAAFTCANGYTSCPDENVQVGEEQQHIRATKHQLAETNQMAVEIFSHYSVGPSTPTVNPQNLCALTRWLGDKRSLLCCQINEAVIEEEIVVSRIIHLCFSLEPLSLKAGHGPALHSGL